MILFMPAMEMTPYMVGMGLILFSMKMVMIVSMVAQVLTATKMVLGMTRFMYWQQIPLF